MWTLPGVLFVAYVIALLICFNVSFWTLQIVEFMRENKRLNMKL